MFKHSDLIIVWFPRVRRVIDKLSPGIICQNSNIPSFMEVTDIANAIAGDFIKPRRLFHSSFIEKKSSLYITYIVKKKKRNTKRNCEIYCSNRSSLREILLVSFLFDNTKKSREHHVTSCSSMKWLSVSMSLVSECVNSHSYWGSTMNSKNYKFGENLDATVWVFKYLNI